MTTTLQREKRAVNQPVSCNPLEDPRTGYAAAVAYEEDSDDEVLIPRGQRGRRITPLLWSVVGRLHMAAAKKAKWSGVRPDEKNIE